MSMKGIKDRVLDIWQGIEEELEEDAGYIDVDDIPVADEAEEHVESLYDSERDYLEQLNIYKIFQGKD